MVGFKTSREEFFVIAFKSVYVQPPIESQLQRGQAEKIPVRQYADGLLKTPPHVEAALEEGGKMKPFVLIAVLLLAVSAAYGQTPDGLTPANEDICDDLMFVTPGLYGMCVAFCEAQDCDTDPALDGESCSAGSERVLERYRELMQPGDPDMPCVAPPPSCPCWTQEEIDNLPYPQPGDETRCSKDAFGRNVDFWYINNFDSNGEQRLSFVETHEVRNGTPYCRLHDTCTGGRDCLGENRSLNITLEEFVICEAQLDQAGYDRQIGCFVDP